VKRRILGRRGRPARSVSVEVIRGLYGQGYSFRAIAQATGVGYGTVRRAFHGLAPLGADIGIGSSARRTSKSGRKTKTAAR
jgi:transposase